MQSPVIREDLDRAWASIAAIWPDLAGRRIFISGGTGFIGNWVLESLLDAESRCRSGIQVTVLTRDPEAFLRRRQHLARHPAVTLLTGDVRSFSTPEGRFDFVIHAAADTSVALNEIRPDVMFDIIVSGTKRVLEFAASSGVRRMLFVSSGAVYGIRPDANELVPEEARASGEDFPAHTAYGAAKREAESLCDRAGRNGELAIVVSRCFAFVGPYLPLDAHYAVGNFILDVSMGAPIRVKGDGTARRSYLYASDLAIWLWTILCRGKACQAYNVGSENVVAISELAEVLRDLSGGKSQVRIERTGTPAVASSFYAPSTIRARTELNLLETVPLRDALERTLRWVRESRPSV